MNISVEEINIVNDGMYEIYTKFMNYMLHIYFEYKIYFFYI